MAREPNRICILYRRTNNKGLIDIYKYNLYLYSSSATIVCSRNTVRKISYISFFCGGDPFWEVVHWPENTHEMQTGLCLLSKLTDLILSFQVPCGNMNILFTPHIFLFMTCYRNLHTLVFFFWVICWSYQQMEISVTLSLGNKLYSLSCETTLLMLSCERTESAKFIIAR